jgi:hypothetical protein
VAAHESNTHLGGLTSEIVKFGFLLERILQSERIIERVRRTSSQPFIFQDLCCTARKDWFQSMRLTNITMVYVFQSFLIVSPSGLRTACKFYNPIDCEAPATLTNSIVCGHTVRRGSRVPGFLDRRYGERRSVEFGIIPRRLCPEEPTYYRSSIWGPSTNGKNAELGIFSLS